MTKAFGQPFTTTASGLTHLFPTPKALAEANLTSIGLTKSRAESIRELARAVRGGSISFDGIVDSDAFLNRLCEIPGIGRWTAQYVAMRALGEPDAFPSGDVALARALALENGRELEQRAEAWRPWRAYAVIYLWNITDDSAVQLEPRRKPNKLALSKTQDATVEKIAPEYHAFTGT